MEGLAHLVDESLIRHGFEPSFDHRRLQWSQWFPCHDSLSILLAPCKPGLFALGEEVIPPGELAVGEGKRMLALFQISEANDLGMALGRLFLSGNPARERLSSGRCFARYVAVEDPAQRRTACTALQRWMASSAQAASGTSQATSDKADAAPSASHVAPDALVRGAEQSSAGPVVSYDAHHGSLVSGHDGQDRGFVSGHDFSRAASAAIRRAALAAEPGDASPLPGSSNEQAQIGPLLPIPSSF
jgi:hypothetical protein